MPGLAPSRCTHLLPGLGVLLLLLLFGQPARGEPEALFGEKPASYWLQKLRSGDMASRRLAAMALGSIAPKSDEVIDELVRAMHQREDEELRAQAASALGRFGPMAKRIVPDLERALTYPDDEDFSVRGSAASSISQIVDDPEFMASRIERTRNRQILIGLLFAHGHTTIRNPRHVDVVVDVFAATPETLDKLYETTVDTLFRLSWRANALVTEVIVRRLRSNPSHSEALGLLDALRKIYGGSDDKPPSKEVVDAVLLYARPGDEDLSWRAADILGSSKQTRKDVVETLLRLLSDPQSDDLLRSSSAKGLGLLQAAPRRALPLLIEQLRQTPSTENESFSWAIAQYKGRAVPVLMAAYRQADDNTMRVRLVEILADLKEDATPATDLVLDELSRASGDLLISLIKAAQGLGRRGLPAVEVLCKHVHSQDQELALAAGQGLASLSEYILDEQGKAPEIKLSWEEPLRHAAARLRQLSRNEGFHIEDAEVRTIERAADRLALVKRSRRALIWGWSAVLLLLAVAIFVVSWRMRRALRVLLGQRWIFAIGDCDFVARVVEEEYGCRVSVAPRWEGLSAVLERKYDLDSSPEAQENNIAPLRQYIGTGQRLRVEVEKAVFVLPWTHALAERWSSSADATIAGQVCLFSDSVLTKPLPRPRLAFGGIWCSEADANLPPLRMARREILSCARIFKEWGAECTISEASGRKADMVLALQHFDVVHVSAHAGIHGIYLQDGLFGEEDLGELDARSIQTRLLVLRACDAAQMEYEGAFLWHLVAAGVNVIAARGPAADYVCSVFFAELYRALLPGPKATGVEVATAIRRASTACMKRLGSSETDGHPPSHVAATLDSFVLYGDPSLHLMLRRPTPSSEISSSKEKKHARR